MLFCILLLVLIKGDDSMLLEGDDTVEDTSSKTITVVTFHDYEVQMTKENDVLNIEVPQNTYILISSLDGYSASVYKTREVSEENLVQTINPDPMNRLIYFKSEGILIVTSTKDSLTFKFHSLPIDKINTDSKLITKLVVSTNTKETFHIYPSGANDVKKYINYSYIYGKIAIWFAKDQVSNATVLSQPSNSIFSVALPSVDPDDVSDITFTDIKPVTETTITSKSRLFVLKASDDEKFPIFIDDSTDIANKDDHYDSFRIAIDDISLIVDTTIVQRGISEDKLGINYIYSMDVFKYGLSSFDFSIPSLYSFYGIRLSIFIFPLKNEIKVNREDDIFGFYTYNAKNIDISSNHRNETLSTIDYKYIILNYDSLQLDMKFIISTSPTEKLIIDESTNKNANFTNDQNSYYYVMASLQDTETTITFTGNIKVYLIKEEKCELIDIKNGDKIEGPFKAEIDLGTQCQFITTPKGELKPNYNDNSRVSFKLATQDALFSIKYQSTYNTFDASKFQNSEIVMNNVDYMKIMTYNIIYIHEQKGWKGEILDQFYTGDNPESLHVGPHLNRTAFYYMSYGSTKVVFNYLLVQKLDHDADFTIHITTHSTSKVSSTQGHECNQLIVFNQIPSYFHITSRKDIKNTIYASNFGNEICLLPVFSIYNIGYQLNESAKVRVIDPKSNILECDNGFNSEDYFGGVLTPFYHYSGDTFFMAYITTEYRKEADAYIHFIYQMLESEKDNGILPEEPKFYSSVKPSTSSGVHTLENMIDQIGNDDDDDNNDDNNTDDGNNDDDNKEETFVIDKQINGQNTVDMSKISLYTLKCPKLTIVHFHKIEDIIIEAYDSNGKKFHELNKNSADRFISFGQSGGEIKIKKASSSKHLLDESKMTYSYFVRNNTPANVNCESVFISNDYQSKFLIGGPYYNGSLGNANVNVSIGQNFCAWFTYPVTMGVELTNDLFKDREIYNNNILVENTDENKLVQGTSILFILLNALYTDQRAEFVPQLPENTDTSAFDQNPICEVVKPNTNGPIKNSNKPPSEPPSEEPTSIVAIVVIIVVVVVVIVVIIVVVVVCVKKKRKTKNENSTDEAQP